jgi:hypothetical protein
MKKLLAETAGWYGAIAIVGAYALISFSLINSSSIWYQVLNLSGALGLVIISFHKKVFQPVALNIIWALIAIFSIFHH